MDDWRDVAFHHDEGPWDPDKWGAMPEPTPLHPSAAPDAPSGATEPPGRANRSEVAPVVTTLIVSPARRTREPAPPVDREKGLRLYLADILERLKP